MVILQIQTKYNKYGGRGVVPVCTVLNHLLAKLKQMGYSYISFCDVFYEYAASDRCLINNEYAHEYKINVHP